jgi:hypothetical protein
VTGLRTEMQIGKDQRVVGWRIHVHFLAEEC